MTRHERDTLIEAVRLLCVDGDAILAVSMLRRLAGVTLEDVERMRCKRRPDPPKHMEEDHG